MSKTFRQFLNEVGFGASGFGANVRSAFWGLPSLYYGGLNTSRTPPGGYQNFGQIAQNIQNTAEFNDPDFIYGKALEIIASLCENVVDAINVKSPADHRYKYAVHEKANMMIYWLTNSDISSGLFPRVKHEDQRRARERGIITETPKNSYPPNYNQQDGILFNINVGVLKNEMMIMAKKLSDKIYGHQAASHVAGNVDKAFELMGQGNQLSQSSNPFQ